jgi:hypothetical protein
MSGKSRGVKTKIRNFRRSARMPKIENYGKKIKPIPRISVEASLDCDSMGPSLLIKFFKIISGSGQAAASGPLQTQPGFEPYREHENTHVTANQQFGNQSKNHSG